ncbi:hypothetical protein HYALB_00000402 [Hymenoscyphus albidus]|uniref:2EXR domain-containing protein n=1 Tax=Hymenoscyphus albidus TaxID=595503 RepID=A0A9N9Q0C1_9HELO|nr:hypothetical protein HYALB_00000402 [Hymenoscyphus albidus]
MDSERESPLGVVVEPRDDHQGAPPPPPPPPGIPPPVPQPPPAPAPLGPGFAYYTPNPFPHAQIKWTPTQASRFISKKHKGSSESTKFKHISFPNFDKLPPELRVRIWILSAPDSRVIELRTWKASHTHSPLKISAGPHSVPSILHTTRESRLEGLRIYHLEEIGISLWKDYDSSELYIPWRYHPENPYADLDYKVRPQPTICDEPFESEKVTPYAPQRIYLSYNRDTIYLGPEFSQAHLQDFLSSPSPFLELPGLQYLALDRKLWLRERDGTWEGLRNALYSLRNRPMKEVCIVPDDDRGALEDRWYYGKHALVFREPLVSYEFIPAGHTEPAKGVTDNLNEWFSRLWVGLSREGGMGEQFGENEGAGGEVNEGESWNMRKLVPKVEIKSVRRGGRQMSDYKDGLWEVQRNLGDMRKWKTWIPGVDV